MTSIRSRVAAVVVLVCAFGLLAATADTGTAPGGPGGAGELPLDGDLLELFQGPGGVGDGSLCPAFLDAPGGLIAALAVIGGGMAAGYRLFDSAIPSVVVGAPIALWSLGCSALVGPVPGVGWLRGFSPSPTFLLALLALGLVGAIGLLWATSDDEWTGESVEPFDPDPPVDLEAAATAAGAAAARIDAQADVENEVYRAWLEMTDHLGVVRPETTTPAEFERRAIAAGMRREDVETLTDCFRDVRYGERDPAPRAERAISALERIEREYAEETE
ncbi:DUF4129 domain-containing protein [Halovivax limisalsi]|uniref:DUF4129 domain-containing protein n=1 Tax=Halovivax limisalsi TaxID=1453760 RepID=UPI001FFC4B64|nr:DUF4129 domain-containing protein [Halovivax limisalsi]